MKLINIIKKMPLRFQHWVRRTAQAWEYQTNQLVITDPKAILLIENTDNPDFVEFHKRLNLMRNKWGIYDCELEQLAVLCSLREFQKGRKMERSMERTNG